MTDYKEFKTSVIPEVETVRLYDETLQHVVDNHPEIPRIVPGLPSIMHAVEQTVCNPTHVERTRSNAYMYVNEGATNASGDPMRVPVKVVEGTAGLVKTFYFASSENVNANVVWRRDEDGER